MHIHRVLAASAFAALTIVVTHVAAQAPPPPAPGGGAAQTPPPQGAPQAPAGRGQGRGRGQAVFPAQQRPPGDPALIERGKALYSTNCSACHGADLRGGGMGGPNLLRSPVVLMDQAGELILPIVRGARQERGMPPLPLPDDDVKAVAEFIHSVLSTARGQGAPPESDAPPPNPIVGDATAGQAYFAARCSSCHSPTGDLQGIATANPDGKMLQNLWVTGGGLGTGRGGGRGGGGASPTAVIATVTLPTGEKIEGPIVRMDNFLVTLRQSDGSLRTVRRDGDVPKVEIKDPLEPHKAMLSTLTDKDMRDVTAYLATLK
jgi:cytochrome c oxidase cbb3-type subunit III